MMRFRSLFTLTLGILAVGWGALAIDRSEASQTGVPADIRKIFGQPRYKNATWGLRVLDGSKVLLDINSGRHFYVGSVRKVFSVGQLMQTVGAGHRYDTPVYRQGSVKNGVLLGNLILVASGDLTMGGRTNPDGSISVSNWDHNEADSLGNAILTRPSPLAGYARLARSVKAAGINRIAGNVIIDDRLFVPFEFRGQFKVRPIFVNDDLVDVSIIPGGLPGSLADVTSRPKTAALTVQNRLRNGAKNSKDTLAIDPFLPACIGSPNCSSAITGSLPINFIPPLTGKPSLVQAVRIVQPSNFARTVFIEALRSAGVAVTAATVASNPVHLLPNQTAYRPQTKVTQLDGMTYAQDAKLILKISYNIGADTSLVLLGVAHGMNSMPGALKFERQNLANRYGISSATYHFVDGSGGGDTWATDGTVTSMLDALKKRSQFQPFFDALPILGVDGSLGFVKAFERDPTLAGAAGAVHAKTGTYVSGSPGSFALKGQAFAGYITAKSGRHLTYVVVVNNVPLSSIDDITKVFQDEGTISAMLWRDY